MNRFSTILLTMLIVVLTCTTAFGQFTNGNVVVMRFGDGAAALAGTGTPVFLQEYTTAGGSPVQTITVPTPPSLNAATGITVAGSSTSEGHLLRSVDGQYLSFTGYAAVVGGATSADAATTTNRVIARVAANGTVDVSTRLTDAYNGSNIRDAISTDGTAFYSCGNGGSGQGATAGTRYVAFGATTSTALHSTTTNGRIVGIYNGQLYYSSSSSPFLGINTVGTGLPTTGGQTVTELPGMPTAGTHSNYGFAINPGGTIMYVADDGAAASGGGIQRWTFSAGTWSLAYTLFNNGSTTTGCRALTVDWSGADPIIYATTSLNPTTLIKVTDTGSGSALTTLATAAANTAFRGVALAPVVAASPTITVTGTLTNFGLTIAGANSSEQTYTVAGSALTADITVTAPSGFQVSTTSGSGFGSAVVLTQTGGTVVTTTIYARFSPSVADGPESGNITHTSTGATTQNQAVAGTAVALEPTTASSVTFGATTASSIVVNYTGGNGTNRIVVAKSGSAVTFSPTDAVASTGVNSDFSVAADQGSGNKIVYDGTGGTVTVSGLSGATTYHFAVYEYNVGTNNSQNYNPTAGTGNQTTATPPLAGPKSIPGDYATVAAAVAALNSLGVGPGGVTFTIAGGYTETAPVGGIVITATGTAANPIVFQKSLVAASPLVVNPIIFAPVGTVTLSATSAVVDGIVSFDGSDYVTFDGIDLQDNNVSGPDMMEYGYGFFKPSATDGCQNNTIKNCVITLNKANNVLGTTGTFETGSRGIYFGNSTRTALVTGLTIAAASGRNDNNTITGNTIQNCFQGIYMRGYGDGVSPYTFLDQNNSIGGSSSGLGNIIRNYGTSTNTTFGVNTFNQNNLLVQFNNINNTAGGGTTASGALLGMSISGSFTLNNSTYNIKNNTITLGQGTNTAQTQGISVGTAGGTGTVTIDNNIITGFTNTSGATAGAVFGTVVANTAGATLNITNNTYSSNQISGAVNMVSLQTTATAAIANITGNSFLSTTMSNNTGLVMVAAGAAVTSALNIDNNIVDGITFVVANSATNNLFQNTGAAATCALSMSRNDMKNITFSVASSSPMSLVFNNGATLSQTIKKNTFTNLNLNTTGSITFMSNNVALSATGFVRADSNSIVTAFNKGGAGGTVTLYLTSTTPSSATGSTKSEQYNNFSNITLTGAAIMAGWTDLEGAPGPAKTINNNTFSNWACGSGAVTVIQTNVNGAGTTISNNTISNITGTGAITAISNTGSFSGLGETTDGNIISTLTSSGTGGAVTGIVGSTAATTRTISNNTISGLSSTGASVIVAGIQVTGGTTIVNVNGNTIGTLSGSGTTSPVVNGLSVSSGTTVNVFKNKIFNLSESGAITTTSPSVNGMLFSGGTTVTAYDNLVGDLRTPAAGLTDAIRGISVTSTTASSTYNVYFNTVYLNASSSGTNFGTTGVFHTASTTATTAALNLRNNIIDNTSTPNGTGLTVGYRRSVGTAGTLANYASSSNNNLFYAGTPGTSRLIYSDGTSSAQTMAAYKAGAFTSGTIAPRDANSVTENPTFLSIAGLSLMDANFLHIDPSVATRIESGAIPIAGITDDYDAQTRNASFPDIGADEFTGTAIDETAPSISYTTLGNGVVTATRSFTNVVAVDPSGVNGTAGARPRVYYKRSTDGNVLNDNSPGTDGWKYAEASGSSSPFSFTIDYSLLNGGTGVSVGNSVQYFVVAQDLAGTPNVGINSGLFAAAPVSVALTSAAFPLTGTINSYGIVGSVSGILTVGSGGTYATLTAASGAFADINAKVVTGNLELQILSDITTEDGVNALNAIAEDPVGSNFTVKIYPTGAARAVSGTNAGGLIRLNGADRVTIDGSLGGGGTDRSLSFTNTNVGTSSAVLWGQTTAGLDGATNNTFKNLNIAGNGNTQTLIAVGFGSTTISTTSLGTGNSNNTIQNCNISKTQFGIYTQGASAGNKNTGNVITQNLINTVSPNNVATEGIHVGFENNIQITQNTIDGIAQAGSVDVFGISLGIPNISTSTFTGNEVTNATVSKNIIGAVRQTNTFSASGIAVAPATSGTNQISNNVLTGVSANGTSGDFTSGIFIGGGAGSTTQVYFNSVSLSGTQTGGSDKSFALAIGGSNPTVDVRNNILYNTQNNGTGNNYAIAFGYSAFTGLTSNFNDLFVGVGATYFTGGTASISAPTNQATLVNLQTATGKDANSVAGDPKFTSLTNLHIDLSAGLSPASNAGTPIAGITTDIDGDTRSLTTPDIGSDEFSYPAPGAFTLLAPANGANPVATNGQLLWTKSAGAVSYDVYLDTLAVPATIVSTSQVDTFYTYAALATFHAYHWKVVAKGPDANMSSVVDTFTTGSNAPLAPTALVLSSVTADQVQLNWVDNATGEDGYRVYRAPAPGGPFTNVSGDLAANSLTYTNTSATPNTHYYYNVRAFSTANGESLPAAADTTTLARVPGAPTFPSRTYTSINVALDGVDNPAATQFAIQDSATSLYVSAGGTISSASPVWQTIATWGGASGKTVTGLLFGNRYTFASKARNANNIETAFGVQAGTTTAPAQTIPYTQGFDSTAFPPQDWRLNSLGTALTSRVTATQANGVAGPMVKFNFFSVDVPNVDTLRTPIFALASATNVAFKFTHAYRTYQTENDTLRILMSIDGGVTWTGTLFNSGNPSLATLSPSTSSYTPSASGDWRSNTLLVPGGFLTDNTRFAFVAKTAFGNNCYIDNVQVIVLPAIDYSMQTIAQINGIPTPFRPVSGGGDGKSAGKGITAEEKMSRNQMVAPATRFKSTEESNVNNSRILTNYHLLSAGKLEVKGSQAMQDGEFETNARGGGGNGGNVVDALTTLNAYAKVSNSGVTSPSYQVDWSFDGASQTSVSRPAGVTFLGQDSVFLSTTPLLRGTKTLSATATVAGDANTGDNTKANNQLYVYPSPNVRKRYDNGTITPTTNVGFGGTSAFTAGVRFTSPADQRIANVDAVYSTNPGLFPDSVLVQLRAAGVDTNNPGAILYSKKFAGVNYNGSGYFSLPFGDDAPAFASGTTYWLQVCFAAAADSFPVGAQSGAGITASRSYYWGNGTGTGAGTPLILSGTPYAWILRSVGAPVAPTFAIDSTSVNFGSVLIPGSKQDTVTVSNGGDFSLNISAVASTNPRFSVTPTSATIPVAGSQQFYITFSPNAIGLQTGNINFTHNAAGSPTALPVSGTGYSNDTTEPVIVYDLVGSTISGGSIVLTATITDDVAVDSSVAGKPRLYYRSGASIPLSGSYSSVSGNRVSPGSNDWTFAFPALSSVTFVEYYVAAQDAPALNAITEPAGTGYTTNPPNGVVASGNRFVVASPLTFTVGASGANFPSITEGLTWFNGGIDGPMQFLLNSDYTSTGEVYPIFIGGIPGLGSFADAVKASPMQTQNRSTAKKESDKTASVNPEIRMPDEMSSVKDRMKSIAMKAKRIPGLGKAGRNSVGTNTFTIKPNTGATPGPISGTAAFSGDFTILWLDGASYVTIDGLTIANAGDGPTVFISDGASHNRILNSTLKGVQQAGNAVGIVWFTDNVLAVNCTDNSIIGCTLTDNGGLRPYGAVTFFSTAPVTDINDTVKNCIITNFGTATTSGGQGIWAIAQTTGLVIEGNDISFTSPAPGNAAASYAGMFLGSSAAGAVLNTTVRNNTIHDMDAVVPSGLLAGISAGSGANIDGALVEGNTIYSLGATTSAATGVRGMYVAAGLNQTMTRNTIKDLHNTAVGGTVQGLRISGAAGGQAFKTTWTNNVIVLGNVGTNGNVTYLGINDNGNTDDTTIVAFNSVYIGGAATGGTTAAYQRSAASVTTLRDNIFMSERDGGAGKHYGIRSTPVSGGIFNSNNNDIYVTGATNGVFGAFAGVDQATLGAWQTASAGDAASLNADPVFVDASIADLHIRNLIGDLSPVANAGIAYGGVTVDIDNETGKRTTTPDIGADEFNLRAPVAFTMVSPANGATNQPLSGTLSWNGSVGSTSFDAYLDVNPAPTTLLANTAGTSTPYSGLSSDLTYYWKVVAKNSDSSTTATGAPFNFATILSTVNVNVSIATGWNMISNPVIAANDSVRVLYPTSSFAFAYSFNAGYVQDYTMENGTGYWEKFPGALSQTVSGLPNTRDTIDVVIGWNMVGSISNSVDTSTIVSIPSGIRASNWYGYVAGYVPVSNLLSGQAYWIKSSAVGKFVLANPLVARPAKVEPSSSIQAVDEVLNSVTITDSRGGSQTLYFGADASNSVPVTMYTMPPTPPVGAFDARFETAEGGSMVQTHAVKVADVMEMPVTIQSDAYPLTISWKVTKGIASYELTDGRGGSIFHAKEMRGEGTMKITNSSVTKFSVNLVGDGSLPKEFALSQNYPNPFNPTTNIKFALPVQSRVTVEIYNVLGQHVSTLVKDELPAGYHVAEWNGTSSTGLQVGSGTYFLKLSATGANGKTFSEVRKLLMLK